MMELILGIGGLLTGAGGMLLFYPQVKRQKDIENRMKAAEIEVKQSEEWKKLYQEERNELLAFRKEHDEIVAQKDAKIDELYTIISHQRDCKAELSKENTELQVEKTRLTILKCEVPNCPKRQPPTGY